MTSTGDLLSVELGNYTGTWDEIGPWIMFNTDGKIYFQDTILDAYDVNVSLWCNDTYGAYDDWEVIEADYFNIYNLGGRANYTITGSAGRTTGGDVFEIYAGGEYGADIFGDNFEGNTTAGWGLYTPNATYNYVEISSWIFVGLHDINR